MIRLFLNNHLYIFYFRRCKIQTYKYVYFYFIFLKILSQDTKNLPTQQAMFGFKKNIIRYARDTYYLYIMVMISSFHRASHDFIGTRRTTGLDSAQTHVTIVRKSRPIIRYTRLIDHHHLHTNENHFGIHDLTKCNSLLVNVYMQELYNYSQINISTVKVFVINYFPRLFGLS